MILYTHSTIENIGQTESGENVWHVEFKDDRQQTIQKALVNDIEADIFIKTGARNLTDKNKKA